MRRSPVLFALSFTALVALPARAQQSMNFWTQCTTGSFQACASVDVTAIYYPPGTEYLFPGNISMGDTELRIRVANLQGYRGAPFGGGPYGFRSVTIGGLQSTTGAALVSFGLESWRHANDGSVLLDGNLDFGLFGYTGSGEASAGWDFEHDSYLYGCSVPSGASPFGGYDATCDGTITYSVLIRRDQLLLNKHSTVTLFGAAWPAGVAFSDAGDGRQHFSCTSGVDCTLVTPEPGTIILLGTGIAGLLGARIRRRRKSQSQL